MSYENLQHTACHWSVARIMCYTATFLRYTDNTRTQQTHRYANSDRPGTSWHTHAHTPDSYFMLESITPNTRTREMSRVQNSFLATKPHGQTQEHHYSCDLSMWLSSCWTMSVRTSVSLQQHLLNTVCVSVLLFRQRHERQDRREWPLVALRSLLNPTPHTWVPQDRKHTSVTECHRCHQTHYWPPCCMSISSPAWPRGGATWRNAALLICCCCKARFHKSAFKNATHTITYTEWYLETTILVFSPFRCHFKCDISLNK